MGLGDRIKELRGGMSVVEFCRQFGIHRNTLPRWESGERTPSAEFLTALVEHYGVDPSWLLLGEGNKDVEPRFRETAVDLAKSLLLGDKTAARRRQAKAKELESVMRAVKEVSSQVWHEIGGDKLPEPRTDAENQLTAALVGLRARYESSELGRLAAEQQANEFADTGEYIKIPRYEIAASAGGGAMVHSEQVVDYLSFRAEWVRNTLGVSVRDLALISVIGDSMEPTLSEGDVVLLDMTTKSVLDGSIYALQLNGGLLVKRIQRKLDGSVVVKSDNPRYDPEEVSEDKADRLKIIGRVVWVGRRL